jgi:hypothetical protein
MGPKRFCNLWPALLLVAGSFKTCRAQESESAASGISNADVQGIISGYRANRDLFPFATANMVETSAYASTIEDAIARQWLSEPKPIQSERRWVTDGRMTRSRAENGDGLIGPPG